MGKTMKTSWPIIIALCLSTVAVTMLTPRTVAALDAEVKVGGEIRVRDVVTNNYDYKDGGDRNDTLTSRTRINVDAKINETTKAYISVQDTRVWGSEVSTATTGNEGQAVDLSQAYFQLDNLFGQPLSLKLGRQMLAYGEHRLIGNFEWSNYGRRFDALKLMYNHDAFSVDLWTAKVQDDGMLRENGAEVVPTSFTDGGNDRKDGYFNGVYATVKTIPANTLDLYLLQKQNGRNENPASPSYGLAIEGQDFFTYGLRLNGAAINMDWTAEGALQSGDAMEDVDQSANFYAVRAGYTLPEAASLRFGAEYVSGSGDEDPTDDEVKTFDNLYPTNHPLYGVSDVPVTNTLSNLTAWSVNVSAKPVKGLKLVAEYWDYTKSEKDDTVGGTVAGEDKIGTEFNIQAWYAINGNMDLHAYWARFSPDDAVTGGGSDDPADNVTVQVAVKF